MKIVQVNTICGSGSIGRICVDLYEILKKRGDTPYVAAGRGMLPPGIEGFMIGNKVDFGVHVLKNFFQGKAGFGSKRVTEKFIAWLTQVKPDVIHLHNIHGFYLQIELLFDYLKKAGIPVVWTLHDCWSFTGHCAYFDYAGCEKWRSENGCETCKIHASAYPYALFKDNSKWSYAAKKAAFTGVPNLTLVSPSQWLAALVKQSFLKEYPVCVIPNGINLEQFTPLSKEQRLANEKRKQGYAHRTVLGVANRWEERKGLPFFIELAKQLPASYTVELLGLDQAQSAQIRRQFPDGRMIPIDRTANVELLASIYRSADVYVNATMEDNFPTTNLEALACGTPVITFRTGGSAEAITPQCGVVVARGDFEALKKAVLYVCGESPFGADSCRAQAMHFDRRQRYMEYISLYERIQSKQ